MLTRFSIVFKMCLFSCFFPGRRVLLGDNVRSDSSSRHSTVNNKQTQPKESITSTTYHTLNVYILLFTSDKHILRKPFTTTSVQNQNASKKVTFTPWYTLLKKKSAITICRFSPVCNDFNPAHLPRAYTEASIGHS